MVVVDEVQLLLSAAAVAAAAAAAVAVDVDGDVSSKVQIIQIRVVGGWNLN